jgi:hypothetical protein
MSCQFAREEKFDSGLDFAGAQCSSLVESHEFAGFKSDPVEGVVDETIHDAHCFP